jgi:hypothetical protein
MNMAKFESKDDPGFMALSGEMHRWVKSATMQKKEEGQLETNRIRALKRDHKQQLMESLRFDQMQSRKATISNAHSRTCDWLLSTPEYLDWLDESMLPYHHGFLWIKGKAGAGKSTLMKYALTNALHTMENVLILSYFFNGRGGHLEKSTLGAYRSLLLELLEKIPSLQSVFDTLDLASRQDYSNHQWTIATLEDLLEKAIRRLRSHRVLCFIDALDECDESQIRNMISFLQNPNAAQFRVCFASRPYPVISMQNCLNLDLDRQPGHNHDIKVYIDSQLNIGHNEAAKGLREEVQAIASGIFMWVHLVVQMLNKAYDRSKSLRALRNKLRDIPKDLHKLFLSIIEHDTEDREQMLLCIQWVLFAIRPLHPNELYYSMLYQLEPGDFQDMMNADIRETTDAVERYILASSKALIQITRATRPEVQFIHESVKDFLVKDGGLIAIWPEFGSTIVGQSHERLKDFCLDCLHNFTGYTKTDQEDQRDDNLYSDSDQDSHTKHQWKIFSKADLAGEIIPRLLLNHAAHSILYHADSAQGEGINQVTFFKRFPLTRYIELRQHFSKGKFKSATLLYIAACDNRANLIRIYPEVLSCFEVENGEWGTPFFAALAKGSTEVTRAFLEAQALSQDLERMRKLYDRCSAENKREWKAGSKDEAWLRATPSPWLERLSDYQLAALLLEGQELDLNSALCAKSLHFRVLCMIYAQQMSGYCLGDEGAS